MAQQQDGIIYRSDEYGELPEISALMEAVFREFIEPGYDPLGTEEFLGYIHPSAIAYRIKRNHFLRVAVANQKIVGVLEMRNYNHLSLLFVDGKFQRQGIAKRLVREATIICQMNNPDLTDITVHSDPAAVVAYEAMNFKCIGEEQVINGIRFIPMKCFLDKNKE